MQKSPLSNMKRCAVHSNSIPTNASTEWFRRKFGDAIQLSEQRKSECERKQKMQSYFEVKKNLEKCLTIRRHEAYERRCNFYNAENELFEEGKEEEEEDEEEDEEDTDEEEGGEEMERRRDGVNEVEDESEKGVEEETDNDDEGDQLNDEEEEESEKGREEEEDEGTDEELEEDEKENELGKEGMVEEEEEEEAINDEQEAEGMEDAGGKEEETLDEGMEDDKQKQREEEAYEAEEGGEEEAAEHGKEFEGVEEEQKELDYESGDEGIELVRRKVPVIGAEEKENPLNDVATIKRKLVDLFDDEASLSGDDVGSDTDGETQDEPDEYEAEEGDLDQLPDTEEIRENLVRQFLKHQNDDSDRRLLRLQEAFFADSDLHGQGSGDRSFRFRMHADANVDWAKLLGAMDEEREREDEDGQEQRQMEEEWHQRRLQMVKWRAQEEERKRRPMKRTRGDEEEGTSEGGRRGDDEMRPIVEPLELDSPLFALGQKLVCSGKCDNLAASPSRAGPSSLPVSTSFSDVSIPPPPKRRDSLLPSYVRRTVADCETDRAVPSPSVEHFHVQNQRQKH